LFISKANLMGDSKHQSGRKWDASDTMSLVISSDGLDPEEYVIATYYLETPSPEILKYTVGVALQQSTGTWVKVKGETPELREKHAAKVTQLFKVPNSNNSYYVGIAFPVSSLTPDFELLLAMVTGEISWWVSESSGYAIKLLDMSFPKSFLDEFKGAKFGMPGIRELLGVYERPILNSMIKPCTGHTTDVHAEVFKEAAYGGVDFVKDDELLGDIPINPLYERLSKCMEIVDSKRADTGENTLYTINVTTRSDRILEKAEKAIQAGANGIMLDSSAGLGILRMLAEDPSIKVPILYHPCFSGTMVASEKSGLSFTLLAKLIRMAGADAMILFSYIGKIPSVTKDTDMQVLAQTGGPLQGKKATACVLAAGIHPGLVPTLLEDFGPEIVIGAGGAIHGHPDGSRGGAKAMRQAIDASIRGIPLEQHAAQNKELKAALQKWGAPRTVEESRALYTLRK
jgi:2,3-diketo-5-methylthiopentyl-1-phosphate enolase